MLRTFSRFSRPAIESVLTCVLDFWTLVVTAFRLRSPSKSLRRVCAGYWPLIKRLQLVIHNSCTHCAFSNLE